MSAPGLAPDGQRIEEPPEDRSSIRLWALLLAGPLLWTLHFGVVYFFAEAACAAREHEEIPLVGSGAIVPVVVGATVILGLAGAAATAASWRVGRRSRGDEAVMAWGGVLLGFTFTVAILAVGIPAVGLDPC